jgi:pimeloyl-ACP methyl ester carboxylesterase
MGQGAPVVFLHGLVMDNLSSWYFTVANRVAQTHQSILYDLRGHGRSERPATGYQVSTMVADLNALLDALDVKTAVTLVGNSFGGLLAVAFALSHPERVAALVLVDAHLNDADWGAQMTATLSLQGQERDRVIAQTFQSWLGRHSERKRTRLAQNAEALVYGTSLVKDLEASQKISDADLAGLSCPVLALYGEDSDSLARGRLLATTLAHCDLRVLPGCTHSVLWEATAHVRDTIVNWLNERAHL